MSDYNTIKVVYGKAIKAVEKLLYEHYCTFIHGSTIHDWVCSMYNNGLAESSTTERVIRNLVSDGVLTPLDVCPTLSQKAFTGMSYSNRGYRDATNNFSTAYGLQTHFNFSIDKTKINI